ncbi:NAD(P)-binding protein [Lentinus brumalis]|uniref:NAD(P)-binding protein n=1 Tax=Lentinus brumalis TaxID=2498619 RepID=A0A371D051_9APHY|nr:NAD(P)-binding protein [Polyporus brumalis]
MSTRPLIVIVGVGNGSGTGGATARVFAKAGYRVALIARGADKLNKVADDVVAIASGAEVATFPIESYSFKALTDVFNAIRSYSWPSGGRTEIRVALYNAGAGVRKSFLDVSEKDIQVVVDANINGAFGFSHQVIEEFKKNEIDAKGKRGTLIFTGATASIRGNNTTSIFSAGKHALRALSQSLNKEFGKENIHVAHFIIDGAILTDTQLSRQQDANEFSNNPDIRLDPASIATGYLYLANQDRSAWTWELDLRPAHEKW